MDRACSPYSYFQIFGTLNVVGAGFAYLLPETRDISLEQMDVLFGVIDADARMQDVETAGRTRDVEKLAVRSCSKSPA